MLKATFEGLDTLFIHMTQETIIALLFLGAMGYLVNSFWSRTRKGSAGCGENCKGCSTIDVDKIEQKFRSPIP